MIRKTLLVIAVLAATVVALTQFARGTPEIAEKEEKSCLVCHTAVGPADLNDQGKYYKDKGTLEGYRAPEPRPSPQPSRAPSRPPQPSQPD